MPWCKPKVAAMASAKIGLFILFLAQVILRRPQAVRASFVTKISPPEPKVKALTRRNEKAGLSSGLFAHINKTKITGLPLAVPAINYANTITERLGTASHQYW
jgi:hypothetical protein